MITETPGTASRLPSETRQVAIIDAVLRLSAARSPGLITTAEIASALGLSQGALFKHFSSKEAIWLAVAERVASGLLETISEAASSANAASAPRAALRAIFLAHVGFFIDHPGVPRFIFHELQRETDSPVKQCLRGLLASYRQLLARVLNAAALRGELDERLDHQAAASLFIGSIQGLVMQSMVADNQLGMREQAEAILLILERGIAGNAMEATYEHN
jgi:TetR/AcrR family transcriptional regulator